MKNLSNADIKEFLSRCVGQSVMGYKVKYDGKQYFMPYETITIQNQKITGLRENEERLLLIEKIIKDKKPPLGSYLDVGCNLGVFVSYFQDIFNEVAGIDCDSYNISQCHFLYPPIKESFTLSDINTKRLSAHYASPFNVITALSMIEYINNKENFIKDLYDLTTNICIIEGHSEDVNKGLDLYYEKLIRGRPWGVTRLEENTDVGLNAPENTINQGRVMWVCEK